MISEQTLGGLASFCIENSCFIKISSGNLKGFSRENNLGGE